MRYKIEIGRVAFFGERIRHPADCIEIGCAKLGKGPRNYCR